MEEVNKLTEEDFEALGWQFMPLDSSYLFKKNELHYLKSQGVVNILTPNDFHSEEISTRKELWEMMRKNNIF